jgi:hypothetical protein
MSLTLAFWLFAVFGLLLYAIVARSSPDEVAARRIRETELLHRRRIAERERAIAARESATAARSAPRPAAPRARAARRKTAPRAKPTARRKRPSTPRRPKARPSWLPAWFFTVRK